MSLHSDGDSFEILAFEPDVSFSDFSDNVTVAWVFAKVRLPWLFTGFVWQVARIPVAVSIAQSEKRAQPVALVETPGMSTG